MSLKDISKDDLETKSFDEIAYLILSDSGKKMKLLDLFKKVCKVLNLPESTVEERIGDFFELLSINKKFVLLPKGYWDLATNHVQNIVIEDDEEDTTSEDAIDEEELSEIEDNEEDEDIFYDDELDEDENEDELKDLVIIEDEENREEL